MIYSIFALNAIEIRILLESYEQLRRFRWPDEEDEDQRIISMRMSGKIGGKKDDLAMAILINHLRRLRFDRNKNCKSFDGCHFPQNYKTIESIVDV